MLGPSSFDQCRIGAMMEDSKRVGLDIHVGQILLVNLPKAASSFYLCIAKGPVIAHVIGFF